MERLQDGSVIKIAAGYVRESTKLQEQGYAPDIQRVGILDCAKQNGFVIPTERMRTDYERGSKISRKGYQEIVEWVRQGEVSAVFVFSFDRFGRNAGEWLTRYDEFQKYKAGLYSVKEGKAHGFLVPAIHAAMAQEYSVNLAAKVTPARERAAREGKHMGRTPIGYVRVYPERRGDKLVKYQAGHLVEDEDRAWFIRDMFERYASGHYSLRAVAEWANSDSTHPRAPKGGHWTCDNVSYVLRSPVYIGRVRYNVNPSGIYEQTADGVGFVEEGLHAGIVEPEVWDRAQDVLAGRPKFAPRVGGKPAPLASGLLVCSGCGGPMTPLQRRNETKGQYVCLWGSQGRLRCTAPSYLMRLAHAALLTEVGRLRATDEPPDPLTFEPVRDEHAETRAKMERELAREREARQRLVKRINEPNWDDDMIEAFRLEGAAIGTHIRQIETHLAALPVSDVSTVAMLELHSYLREHPISDAIAEGVEQGVWEVLRELCLTFVKSAVVTERRPAFRSRWLRVKVTWVPDIQTLIDVGSVYLAPPEESPAWLG